MTIESAAQGEAETQATAYEFPSQAWADRFKQEIADSTVYRNVAHSWEGDVILVIQGEGGLYLDLWHGECREATYLVHPTPKAPEFKITATMENWRKVLAGHLDPIQGLMGRQLHLEGNLLKIMQHVNAAKELLKCATRVPIAA
ncbi:MAG: SCP2 sterol-binding domain-containing protein [Caldilineaceae bacterium]